MNKFNVRFTALLLALLTSLSVVSCTAPAAESETSSGTVTLKSVRTWLDARLARDGIDTPYILGDASSAGEYGLDLSSLTDDGYIIRKDAGEDTVLIFGKTAEGADMAARCYAKKHAGRDVINVVEGELYRVGRITVGGRDLSEFVIVCPADADDSMRYAASELRKYLGDACGVYPEIVTEASGPALTLAKDPSLGDQGVRIEQDDGGITFFGGRYSGCLNAVYEFLREYIGYTFYYDYKQKGNYDHVDNAVSYLYKSDEIVLDDVHYEKMPSIEVRSTYTGSGGMYTSPKMYYNGECYVNDKNYGVFGTVWKACHGIEGYFTRDELKEDWNAGYELGVQPCFTNEDFTAETIRRVHAKLDAAKAAGSIMGYNVNDVDVAHIDVTKFCSCKNCQAVMRKYKATSGTVISFANAVAESLEEDYPEIYVGVFAYAGTTKPPENLAVHKMVMVSYCIYVGDDGSIPCSNHSVGDLTCPAHETDRQNLEGWGKLTDNIYIWYYPFTSDEQMSSATTVFEVYYDITYLASLGVYGIFALNGTNNIPYDFDSLGYYMQQRVMWDADMTFDEYCDIIKEYLYLVYGDGYDAVYEYLVLLEEAGDHRDHWCGFWSAITERLDFTYIKNNADTIERCYSFARDNANSAWQEHLVDTLFASAYYLICCATHTSMWKNGTDADRAIYKERLDKCINLCRENKAPLYIVDSTNTWYYPPTDADPDVNPLEWYAWRIPENPKYEGRPGGWTSDYDF